MTSNEYFKTVSKLLPKEKSVLAEIVNALYACIERGNSIWIIGNGGSASTADHFEVDLSFVRNNESKKVIKAKSLCSNSSLLTAIGNDIGFENVFAHQIARQATNGDVCFSISASGNSKNLIRAFHESDLKGLQKIALLGFDGGKLSDLADLKLIILSAQGMYGPVEDIHLSVCHFIAVELKTLFFGGSK